MAHHAFEHVQDVFLLHEAHFAVDLGEFRLTVGAEVFVAEALHNLEVAVHTGHHETLLEGLGALRQGVEGAGVHARRHHEVARALGRGVDKERGFDFQEAVRVEIFAGFVADAVPQLQGLLKRVAPKVEVAVLGTEILAAVGVVLDGEGRSEAGVEDVYGVELYLNVARGHFGILAGTLHHGADCLDHELAAEAVRRIHELCRGVRLNHQLRDAVAVAKVDEGHTAQLARALYPTCQCYFLSCV